MNEEFNFDFHIHSKYSYDSLLSPEIILKRAVSKGLDAVAITDHNTIKGSIIAKLITQDSLLIVNGAEIATNYGDLIGLFLNEELHSRIFEEVIDEIRDQNGLVVLPHPCRRKKFPPPHLLGMIDIFEGINARNSDVYNINAQKLSQQLKKPMIAGSDAHTIFEIGNAWTSIPNKQNLDEDMLRKMILNGQNHLFQANTWQNRRVNQIYSTLIKFLK
jgi:predicted metal-dependent phosphoesterase TrpH